MPWVGYWHPQEEARGSANRHHFPYLFSLSIWEPPEPRGQLTLDHWLWRAQSNQKSEPSWLREAFHQKPWNKIKLNKTCPYLWRALFFFFFFFLISQWCVSRWEICHSLKLVWMLPFFSSLAVPVFPQVSVSWVQSQGVNWDYCVCVFSDSTCKIFIMGLGEWRKVTGKTFCVLVSLPCGIKDLVW